MAVPILVPYSRCKYDVKLFIGTLTEPITPPVTRPSAKDIPTLGVSCPSWYKSLPMACMVLRVPNVTPSPMAFIAARIPCRCISIRPDTSAALFMPFLLRYCVVPLVMSLVVPFFATSPTPLVAANSGKSSSRLVPSAPLSSHVVLCSLA